MSDVIQDIDTVESDVAIEAQSRLDRDAEADDGAAISTALILNALEKLAGATDEMARRLGDRLEQVRADVKRERGGGAEQVLRQNLAEGLDSIGARSDKGLQRLGDRLDQRLDALVEELVEPTRERLAEMTEQLKAQDETARENADRLDQRLAEAAQAAREQVAETVAPLSGSVDELRAALDAWKTSFDELQQIAQRQRERIESLDAKVESVKEAISEQVSDVRDELREEIAALRRAQEESSAASDQARDAAFAKLKGEFERGQRASVADLAEGLGLAQTSAEKHFEHLEQALADMQKEQVRRFEDWSNAQSARVGKLEEQARSLSQLGEKLERNHGEMVTMVEAERERIEEIERLRRREQARRVNNSGVARYHAGDFEQARRLFDQAVELDKDFAEAFNNLGLALTELGENDDATVAFETAIELDPELGAGYNNLGYVLYLQENYEAAVEMYKEAIGRQHDTSAAYTNLGNAHQKLGRTEQAVEAWRRALEVDPGNERARKYLHRFGADLPPAKGRED